jgi:hypothetical protein
MIERTIHALDAQGTCHTHTMLRRRRETHEADEAAAAAAAAAGAAGDGVRRGTKLKRPRYHQRSKERSEEEGLESAVFGHGSSVLAHVIGSEARAADEKEEEEEEAANEDGEAGEEAEPSRRGKGAQAHKKSAWVDEDDESERYVCV